MKSRLVGTFVLLHSISDGPSSWQTRGGIGKAFQLPIVVAVVRRRKMAGLDAETADLAAENLVDGEKESEDEHGG
jgi:hypothetical protein